ncbi:hypothetical protein C3L33_09021, partial [Rhododendron williamsianum]
MAVQWLLVCHGLVTLLVVISFLCGQWPIFQGTFIERIHYFIAFGLYDYFRYNLSLSLSLSLQYTSLLAVAVGILLFLLTSFSDPGTVNAENVSLYLSAYPYDNMIYSEKEYLLGPSTAAFAIGVWLGLTITVDGWHFLLCIYGTVAIGLILAGQVKEFKVIYILKVYYGIENSFWSLAPHVVQWLLVSYNNQILLMVFLAIVSLLLSGFFGYHAHLCLTNTTTNETFKWEEYLSWQTKVHEAKASDAALDACISGLSNERKPPVSKWKAFFRRSRLEDVQIVKDNFYDKGSFQNLHEIVFPLSTRPPFSQAKSKLG